MKHLIEKKKEFKIGEKVFVRGFITESLRKEYEKEIAEIKKETTFGFLVQFPDGKYLPFGADNLIKIKQF